ncbi:MAG: hypothetical protein WCK59_02635 [Candidatus Falkowbacteria bacterium]
MNKKLLFGTASLGLLLILSACSTGSSAPTASSGSNSNGAPAPAKGGPGRQPDYGQPATPPEIRGLVKSIVGNEVDILKIDQPQRATSTDANSAAASTTRTPSLSLGGAGNTGGRGQGGGGFGFAGGGRGQGGASSTTDRTAMLARIKAMSTGEDQVVIPVGIKMLKADPNSTGRQRTMVEATLSDITADKMITIWLDNSVTDKKVASFVMIN